MLWLAIICLCGCVVRAADPSGPPVQYTVSTLAGIGATTNGDISRSQDEMGVFSLLYQPNSVTYDDDSDTLLISDRGNARMLRLFESGEMVNILNLAAEPLAMATDSVAVPTLTAAAPFNVQFVRANSWGVMFLLREPPAGPDPGDPSDVRAFSYGYTLWGFPQLQNCPLLAVTPGCGLSVPVPLEQVSGMVIDAQHRLWLTGCVNCSRVTTGAKPTNYAIRVSVANWDTNTDLEDPITVQTLRTTLSDWHYAWTLQADFLQAVSSPVLREPYGEVMYFSTPYLNPGDPYSSIYSYNFTSGKLDWLVRFRDSDNPAGELDNAAAALLFIPAGPLVDTLVKAAPGTNLLFVLLSSVAFGVDVDQIVPGEGPLEADLSQDAVVDPLMVRFKEINPQRDNSQQTALDVVACDPRGSGSACDIAYKGPTRDGDAQILIVSRVPGRILSYPGATPPQHRLHVLAGGFGTACVAGVTNCLTAASGGDGLALTTRINPTVICPNADGSDVLFVDAFAMDGEATPTMRRVTGGSLTTISDFLAGDIYSFASSGPISMMWLPHTAGAFDPVRGIVVAIVVQDFDMPDPFQSLVYWDPGFAESSQFLVASHGIPLPDPYINFTAYALAGVDAQGRLHLVLGPSADRVVRVNEPLALRIYYDEDSRSHNSEVIPASGATCVLGNCVGVNAGTADQLPAPSDGVSATAIDIKRNTLVEGGWLRQLWWSCFDGDQNLMWLNPQGARLGTVFKTVNGLVTTVLASVPFDNSFACDGRFNLFVTDGLRIYQMNTQTHAMWLIAGSGRQGYGGDTQLSTAASVAFNGVRYLTVVPVTGQLLFADLKNGRIRVLTPIVVPQADSASNVLRITLGVSLPITVLSWLALVLCYRRIKRLQQSLALAQADGAGRAAGGVYLVKLLALATSKDIAVQRIPPSEVTRQEEVGRGAFSVVYKANWHGGTVALKLINNAARDPQITAELVNELLIISHLGHHPCIVPFVGGAPEAHQLIFHFVPHGSVEQVLITQRLYPIDGLWGVDNATAPTVLQNLVIVSQMLVDASAGVLHCHAKHTIHRDISARNFLVDPQHRVTLCDFGLSRFLPPGEACGRASPCLLPISWSAPETLRNLWLSEKTDVWAFSMFVFECVARSVPYPGMAPQEIALAVLDRGLRPVIPAHCPVELNQLMRQCWQTEPEDRPNMQTVYDVLQGLHVRYQRAFESLSTESPTALETLRSVYLPIDPNPPPGGGGLAGVGGARASRAPAVAAAGAAAAADENSHYSNYDTIHAWAVASLPPKRAWPGGGGGDGEPRRGAAVRRSQAHPVEMNDLYYARLD